jgi:hypothetical protein
MHEKISPPGNHAGRDLIPDYDKGYLYEGAAQIASGLTGITACLLEASLLDREASSESRISFRTIAAPAYFHRLRQHNSRLFHIAF